MIKENDFFVMVDNSGYHRIQLAEKKLMDCSNKCKIDIS